MDVAFTINPLGLEGLGATLCSLIQSCSNPASLKLWFFCSAFEEKHKESINALLAEKGFFGQVKYTDFNAKAIFGHLKALHGDWTSYGRLLIPDYVTAERVLYLDADLIILADIIELESFSFGENFLAAATGGRMKYALEHQFLTGVLGIAPESDYFNAGVLYMNLSNWAKYNVQGQWKKLANKYPDSLLAVDQTILNGVSRGVFAHLPARFNNAWCPGDSKPAGADDSILHFVGSPKPWDLTGAWLHEGYATWKGYNTIAWHKEYNKITREKIIRTWKIRNSIVLKARKKIIGKE